MGRKAVSQGMWAGFVTEATTSEIVVEAAGPIAVPKALAVTREEGAAFIGASLVTLIAMALIAFDSVYGRFAEGG